ncbi:MAG: type II toxin-antitoxin system HicB family antitoxin [Deltaproteobacteria bacterium]|nr:type II toxin-antitoxin system HicB family antitoxin [Deltaproteobacteria bacterium]
MDSNAYRIVVTHEPDVGAFRASVPELPGVEAVGQTRPEAVESLVEALDARLVAMAEQGQEPPEALDRREFSGNLEVMVSPDLHRELVWQSTVEDVPVAQLVTEILAAGLERRALGTLAGMSRGRQGGGDHRDNRRRGRHDRMDKSKYLNIMEDRASFIEYVRGLDGGARGGGSNGRRRK